jgi:serine/threonine protein kinase
MAKMSDYLKAAQETAATPQETATVPQETATPPQGTATAPTEGSSYSGAQADIIVQNGKILKVYKPGCSFNNAVLPLVKQLKGHGFVVDLYDYGTMDFEGSQRAFELMEYCPEGAVSAVSLKGDKDSILKIVCKVAKALDACHREGFIHKDVKPANILVRDKATWDCVLCDFGIADVLDHGKANTQQSRTPIYAAPEVYEHTVTIENKTYCELTPAADFYSLGMTILCLWYGESAFRSKESVLAMQKVHDGIVVPIDIPDPLYTITRGLLIKDPAHRWGLKEINDYLDGKPVDVYEEHRQNGLNIIFNSSKSQIAHSPEELAAFMVDDMDLAIKYLYSGKISKWLEHIPELQIEIENIVEKEFPNDQKTGLLAAIHTLNPFYDLRLCCDLHDPDYAMTGATLGKALNQAYDHYFTRNDSTLLDDRIIESFFDGDSTDYVPWFLDHKGNRFAQQHKWFDYCVQGDRKNSKKAGPKDTDYLHQVAVMKTIAGFGAQPEYRLSRTGEVLCSIDDVYKAPKEELLYDLQNDNGLRGWLAVLCHENPHTDLKPKYTYEKLLEQYLQLIGYINPDDTAYSRFHQAQEEVQNIVEHAKNQIRGTWTTSFLQKALGLFLGVIPLALLLTRIILNIIDNPTLDVSGGWTSYLFYGLGLVAAVIVFFVNDSDGCLIPIIVGAVISIIITFLLSVIGSIVLYLFALIALGVFIFFTFPILFDYSRHRTKIKAVTKPGFEELTLEPLYFAFNNEKNFDSSLNGAVNASSTSRWKEDVRERWILLLFFVGSTIILSLFGRLLPESERMNRFDQFLKKPFTTEITSYDEVQEMSDPEP